jgi:hypothetical protein
MRVVHLTDIHVQARPHLDDMTPKRVLGTNSYVLGRRTSSAGWRNARCRAVDANPDLVVFTGERRSTESEFDDAREWSPSCRDWNGDDSGQPRHLRPRAASRRRDAPPLLGGWASCPRPTDWTTSHSSRWRRAGRTRFLATPTRASSRAHETPRFDRRRAVRLPFTIHYPLAIGARDVRTADPRARERRRRPAVRPLD